MEFYKHVASCNFNIINTCLIMSTVFDNKICLNQHLTAFDDLALRCGLVKKTLQFAISFSLEFSSPVGCPPSGAKKW